MLTIFGIDSSVTGSNPAVLTTFSEAHRGLVFNERLGFFRQTSIFVNLIKPFSNDRAEDTIQ